MFPCNCADPADVCDMNSGECSASGCKDGTPEGEGFMWSGPGCRVGMSYAFTYLNII